MLAVFAHPDDERVIGPLLSRLAREGRETHLVIATDGSKGVRDFAHIPAGAELAAARTKEANCAANRLGVRQLHILGLPDGGLASFEVLGKLRSALAAIIDSLKPAAIITFGPEGGTGHPDHRLVGDVVTQIVQSDARYANIDLLYASLPTERLRTAPPAQPTVNGMAEALLTVRVPFEERDLVAGARSSRVIAASTRRRRWTRSTGISRTRGTARSGCVRGTGRCMIAGSSNLRCDDAPWPFHLSRHHARRRVTADRRPDLSASG